MRATLEQLKAMSDSQLYYAWGSGQFPFEYLRCSRCLTQHHEMHGSGSCPRHASLSDQISKMPYARSLAFGGTEAEFCAAIRPHLEELYALRLFYDSLYPQEVKQPPELGAIADGDNAQSLHEHDSVCTEKR